MAYYNPHITGWYKSMYKLDGQGLVTSHTSKTYIVPWEGSKNHVPIRDPTPTSVSLNLTTSIHLSFVKLQSFSLAITGNSSDRI